MTSVRRLRRAAGLILLAALLDLSGPNSVWSQQNLAPPLPTPQLHYASPGGVRAGSTVEIALTGQNLDTAEGLLFDVPGVKAELVSAPPTPEMKKGGNQKGATVTARFKVTVPPDAPPGIHDVRLVSKWGVSNPRAFVIGDVEEVEEKEPNNDVDQAQRVPLNSAVTGTISTPTDVDYYLFEGKKGQRVVVSCLASSIDSKLQPQIQLHSRTGQLLAMNRDYNGFDALLDATLPADGEYYVRVVSFTYTQGSPEHFYRLTISTAPWIDAVYPPVVEPGKETKVTVYGRNLPGGVPDPKTVLDGRVLEKATVTVRPPADAKATRRLAYGGHVAPRMSGMDGFELRLKNDAGTSNPYLLTYALAPVVLDNGANDTADTAQELTLPCEVAGRIEKVRDRDWYRFSVKKGETYSIEVYGDRLGSTLDMYFKLHEVKSSKVQELDDNPDVLHPLQFYTRTEDPQRYRLTATEDATYLLQVSSREADIQAGPRHLYRLRITEEKPDFRLIVLPPATNGPDSVLLYRGTSQAYSVLVWRQDGFNGDITLSAEGLPPGVTCAPQVVGPGARQGALVLTASADAASWTGTFTVKGRAVIAGKTVEVEARPADVTWSVGNQNVPTVARLSRGLALAVRDGALFHFTAKAEKTDVLSGEKLTVSLNLTPVAGEFKGPVQVTLLNPMQQQLATFNNNQPLTLSAGKETTAVLDLKSALPPGTYTFAVRAQGQVPYHRDPEGKQKATATVYVAAAPLTVTVVPKQLATVKVSPGTPNLKIGAETEVTVKVDRMYDFAGEFKVQLILGNDAKGISAEEVTIPAGKDEVKLPIKVAAGTASGGRNNLVVRATALFNGKTPTTQEAKISVTLVK
jgi:hypothetical protein